MENSAGTQVTPPEELQVVVNTLGGQTFEYSMDVGASVFDLKSLLGKSVGMPAGCQKLIFGMAILEDAVKLADVKRSGIADGLIDDTMQLSFMLAISADGALKMLRDADPKERLAAVKVLAKVGARDYECVAPALCQCCTEDPSFYVRQEAERSLTSIALSGDEQVLAALLVCLNRHDCSDHRGILRAVSRMFEPSDDCPGAPDAPERRTHESQPDCSWEDGQGIAVVDDLTQLALYTCHQEAAIVALATCLEDASHTVRRHAGKALGKVVHHCCGELVDDEIYLKAHSETCRRLRRRYDFVRYNSSGDDFGRNLAAMQALVEISRVGDMRSVVAVCQFLEHDEEELRRAAVVALSKLVIPGSSAMESAVRSRNKRPNSETMEQALYVVRHGTLPLALDADNDFEGYSNAGIAMEAATGLSSLKGLGSNENGGKAESLDGEADCWLRSPRTLRRGLAFPSANLLCHHEFFRCPIDCCSVTVASREVIS